MGKVVSIRSNDGLRNRHERTTATPDMIAARIRQGQARRLGRATPAEIEKERFRKCCSSVTIKIMDLALTPCIFYFCTFNARGLRHDGEALLKAVKTYLDRQGVRYLAVLEAFKRKKRGYHVHVITEEEVKFDGWIKQHGGKVTYGVFNPKKRADGIDLRDFKEHDTGLYCGKIYTDPERCANYMTKKIAITKKRMPKHSRLYVCNFKDMPPEKGVMVVDDDGKAIAAKGNKIHRYLAEKEHALNMGVSEWKWILSKLEPLRQKKELLAEQRTAAGNRKQLSAADRNLLKFMESDFSICNEQRESYYNPTTVSMNPTYRLGITDMPDMSNDMPCYPADMFEDDHRPTPEMIRLRDEHRKFDACKGDVAIFLKMFGGDEDGAYKDIAARDIIPEPAPDPIFASRNARIDRRLHAKYRDRLELMPGWSIIWAKMDMMDMMDMDENEDMDEDAPEDMPEAEEQPKDDNGSLDGCKYSFDDGSYWDTLYKECMDMNEGDALFDIIYNGCMDIDAEGMDEDMHKGMDEDAPEDMPGHMESVAIAAAPRLISDFWIKDWRKRRALGFKISNAKIGFPRSDAGRYARPIPLVEAVKIDNADCAGDYLRRYVGWVEHVPDGAAGKLTLDRLKLCLDIGYRALCNARSR